jgi:hypothetical protein
VKNGNRPRAGGSRNKPRTGAARNKPRPGSAQSKPGTGGAQDTSRSGNSQGKQPWFGSRASGMGYRPRTWQGYLVTLLLGAYAIFIGTLSADHHSPLILLAIAPAALVPRLIGLLQQR